MRRLFVVAAVLLCACQSENFERVSLDSQGLSVRILKGFDLTAEKGAIVFSGPGKATIVVRAIDKNDPRRGERTSEEIASATREVLRSYRGARISDAEPVEDANMQGQSYSLTFQPSGTSAAYQRRHVVLFGAERVYHLWHTAPDGELEATEKQFQKLVASAREEG